MESLILPSRLKDVLRRLVHGRKMEHRLWQRGQIILGLSKGQSPIQIARALGITPPPVYKWRQRWEEATPALAPFAQGQGSAQEVRAAIEAVLVDAPRSGKPATFTPEMQTQLMALACESPADSDYPISHWSARELRQELIRRQIVSDISVRSVGRFLKGG